jgi:trehalose 6-phosphate synthase
MPGVVEDEAPSPGRLLLVSNRLPITIRRSDDGTYSFSMSSGGLVTGLSGLSKTTSFQWYGWPGLEVPDAEAGPMIQRLQDEYDAHPVFVDDELADRHYNGFASESAHHPSSPPPTCEHLAFTPFPIFFFNFFPFFWRASGS